MKKETILLVVGALIIGLLVGILVTKGGKSTSQTAAPQTPQGAPVVDQQKNISMLEQVVAREPANRNAWVQLGHTLFDSDQPFKAVEAYDKALALDGNDPDVLTDQGVMFRRIGSFETAIKNFKKAIEIQPNHL